MTGLVRIDSAQNLPDDWDVLKTSIFQSRDFLLHLEQTNPCVQRYYLFLDRREILACAVVYSLRLDFLTYAKIPSPVKLDIIGIPVSCSVPGFFGPAQNQIAKAIMGWEKGFLLYLNTISPIICEDSVQGQTLPTCILPLNYASIMEYNQALRSDYRRRMNRIRDSFSEIIRSKRPFSEFSSLHYELYLGAFERSSAKLEKLEYGFFRTLPELFEFYVFEHPDLGLIGWIITVNDNSTYTFFMGGVNQKYNKDFQIYQNLLFNIIELGIEQKAKQVDFGQTAEIPKTRTGAKIEPRGMSFYNRWKIIRKIVRHSQGFLEYKSDAPSVNVLKS